MLKAEPREAQAARHFIPVSWPAAPYKGLNYYTAADAPVFAEREDDIESCTQIVGPFSTRILLLHGRSGAGKSSFLRAGLLPRLELDDFCFIRQRDAADPMLIRCTDDPIIRIQQELADALTFDPLLKELKSRRRAAMALGGESVDRMLIADLLLKALDLITRELSRNLVLVVDQAEEIFTLRSGEDSENRQKSFFYFIEELCVRDARIKVIVCLRTEYYGQFCDGLRIDPGSKVSPHLGLEQFMLHGLRQREQIIQAVARPTLKEPVEPYGVPFERYRFEYETGVPERIADDLLQHAGESSTLPLLQIACKALYQEVVIDGNRTTITQADYARLGGVQGQMDAFITGTIRRILRAAALLSHHISDDAVFKWLAVLATLVARQEGGTVTTLIADEERLLAEAERQHIRGAVGETLREMAKEKWRLLRPVAIVTPEGSTTAYSLGHDAIALAIFQWNEARSRFIAERRQQELTTRRAKMSAVVAIVIAAVGAILAGLQVFVLRDRTIQTLLIASDSFGTAYREPLLLRAAALSGTQGIWQLVFNRSQIRLKMEEILAISPSSGGLFEAVGLDKAGTRIARLAQDGTVSIQTLGSASAAMPFGQVPAGERKGNEPWGSAIGFIDGMTDPVVYRTGALWIRRDGAWQPTPVKDLYPLDFKRAQNIPWIEINGGSIRLSVWNSADSLMNYQLIGLSSDTKTLIQTARVTIAQPVGLWPERSTSSDRVVTLERSAKHPTLEVVLQDLRDENSRAVIEEINVEFDGQPYLRSFAFAGSEDAIAVRDSNSRFRVIPTKPGGGGKQTFEIPDGLNEPAHRRFFAAMRPVLGATKTENRWLFAWVAKGGVQTMIGLPGVAKGIQFTPAPLLPEIPLDSISQLRWTGDGRFLVVVGQRGWQEPFSYRVWEFPQPEFAKLTDAELVTRACEVAKLENMPLPVETLERWGAYRIAPGLCE
jgi:hypothetical protein